MKSKKNLLANALGLTTIILWSICSTLVWLFPGFAMTVTEWWMHGMSMGVYQINLQNFFLGGLSMTIAAWVTGYVLGWSIEYLKNR